MKIARLAVCAAVCLSFHLASGLVCCAQDDVDDPFFDSVVGFLKDEDNEMRAIGLEQVRRGLEGEAATKKLAALLLELPPQPQVGLISALADRGDLAAREAVLGLVDGEDGDPVRIAAIRAIGNLGKTADTPMLIQLIAEAPEAEKQAARASLTRLQGEGVLAAIAAEMQKAEPSMSVALIEILTDRRALDTIPDILEVAVGDNATVRTAAMKSLGLLASAEHVSGMIAGVLRAEPGRERDAAEKAVMVVCAGSKGDVDQRAEPLLAAYNKASADERNLLLTTLGRIGGADALKVVEAAIADADSATHGLGIRAICNWPNATIASRLLELANDDKHESHRLSTLRALIRVAPLPDETRTDIERVELLKTTMSMATRYEESFFILDRVRTIHDVEALRFVMPYMDRPIYVERACLSVVELAHLRDVRTPNQEEFDRALDRVIELSKSKVIVDRAEHYKVDKTWDRAVHPSPVPVPPKSAIIVATEPQKQGNTEQDSVEQDSVEQDNAEQDNAEQDNAEQDNAEQDNAEQDDAESEEQDSLVWILVVVIGGCFLLFVCWCLVSKR